MTTNCERCQRLSNCTFYGRPSDVESDRAQNGEWLCDGCVYPRMAELDDAIASLEGHLGEMKAEDTNEEES